MGTRLDKYANSAPYWDTPVIIESHINGRRTKEMNPHTPIKPDEIIKDAIECWDAGACAIHAHPSSFELKGEAAGKDYMESWETILKERPDMLWLPTTCNPAILEGDECGLEHYEWLKKHANLRVGCIDPGMTVFASDFDEEKGHLNAFAYPWTTEMINNQVDLLIRNNLGMIWGVYEPGYLRTALQYIKRGRYTKGSSIDFYLIGDYGLNSTDPVNTSGMPPTLESLYYYLDMIAGLDLPWYISIWGEGSFNTRPVIKRAIELGGHIKVGLEMHYDPRRNATNLELLKETQEIAREVGRPIATHEQALEILGLEPMKY